MYEAGAGEKASSRGLFGGDEQKGLGSGLLGMIMGDAAAAGPVDLDSEEHLAGAEIEDQNLVARMTRARDRPPAEAPPLATALRSELGAAGRSFSELMLTLTEMQACAHTASAEAGQCAKDLGKLASAGAETAAPGKEALAALAKTAARCKSADVNMAQVARGLEAAIAKLTIARRQFDSAGGRCLAQAEAPDLNGGQGGA